VEAGDVAEGGAAAGAAASAVAVEAVAISVGEDPLSSSPPGAGAGAGGGSGPGAGANDTADAVTVDFGGTLPRGSVAHPPPPPADLVCSAAFVSRAVGACARAGVGAGSEPAEALLRCLERGCRGSLERAGIVLREALRGLRSEETELGAGLCAAVLVHLLTRLGWEESEQTRELFASTCRREGGGLVGIALELLQATPPDGSGSAVAAAEDSGGTSAAAAAPPLWTECARVYLCITTLLDVHGSGERAGGWTEELLVGGDDVEAMLRWLKEASRSPALGRSVERARLLGIRRGGRYERTEGGERSLEQLRALQRAVQARAKAAKR
jgi:hypothetical protein